MERCSDLCREYQTCKWFTFNALTLECFLYPTCDSVQKTCPQCTSSGNNCKGKTGKNQDLNVFLGGTHATQHKDTNQNNIQHTDTQHKGYFVTLNIDDTQHKQQSTVMLSVVILTVMLFLLLC
jgi:hypothetical protein